MPLNPAKLADDINVAIDAKDANGLPIATTPQMLTYASAIIASLVVALVSHLPGKVKGVTAALSPLQKGEAEGGIAAVTPGPWIQVMSGGFPTSNPALVAAEATAGALYITGAANVKFAIGRVLGQCTSVGPPSPAPGPLVAGTGTNGTVEELVGADWAKVATPPLGDPELAEKIYTAVAKHIEENATVTYAPNLIVGLCPATAGDLEVGAGAGGLIL